MSKSLQHEGAGMKVRFIMYPGEIGMTSVYERLFNLDPNQRSSPIKRLLGYLSSNPTLPAWFMSMPAAPIKTHRQQTVRLNLTERDLDLVEVKAVLEPMNEAERINHIKRMFAQACSRANPDMKADAPLELLNVQERAHKPSALIPPQDSKALPTSDEDKDKASKIKRSAEFLRRSPEKPTQRTTP